MFNVRWLFIEAGVKSEKRKEKRKERHIFVKKIYFNFTFTQNSAPKLQNRLNKGERMRMKRRKQKKNVDFKFFIFIIFSLSLSQINNLSHMHSVTLFAFNPTAGLRPCTLLSRPLTAGRAETVQPCRSRPVSGGPCAGLQEGGPWGSGRTPGRSRPRSCRHPSGCGRRRWWRSCRSRCRSPSSCPLVGETGRAGVKDGVEDEDVRFVCVCVCWTYLHWRGSWPDPGSSWTSFQAWWGQGRSTEQPCLHTPPRSCKTTEQKHKLTNCNPAKNK